MLAGVLAVLGALPASGQDVDARHDAVREDVAGAQDSHLRFLAPRHVERAADRLRDASARRDEGAPAADVLEALSRAERALERARELEERGLHLLSPGLRAREAAAGAGAEDHAPELWAEGEEALRSAGREVEDGDDEDARRTAGEATRLYRRAAATALERRVLGEAREARAEAAGHGARERAPRTWSRADSLVRRAEASLERAAGADAAAGGVESAREAAREAAAAFRRAARLAARADTARSSEGAVEELLLRYERALERLADSLGIGGAAPDDPAVTADSALAALARRADDREELRGRLDSARVAAGQADGRADSLAAEVDRLSRRLDTVAGDLQRRRSREAKLREVRALFAGEEAGVLTSGDSLVLRLVGMSFPSGEAEVGEEARALLVKVQSALRTFPEARVAIEGHTDSRGDEDRNRTLSRERAISVREWLLARTPLSADRITARGHGERRPIATNDTEEGRAANRRIEVMLLLPPP